MGSEFKIIFLHIVRVSSLWIAVVHFAEGEANHPTSRVSSDAQPSSPWPQELHLCLEEFPAVFSTNVFPNFSVCKVSQLKFITMQMSIRHHNLEMKPYP